jgi:hypothetical protein
MTNSPNSRKTDVCMTKPRCRRKPIVSSPIRASSSSCSTFADEWLDLRKLRRDIPDERLYPEYRKDDYLVDSMAHETRAFLRRWCEKICPPPPRHAADFTFVNDRLAGTMICRVCQAPPCSVCPCRKAARLEVSSRKPRS